MIGQQVSKYEVIREIGRGGMGVVFHASDPDLRREVALKVLSPARTEDARRRRRLVNEARAASSLDHPGIVTIFDILRHRDSDVIVMELIEGRSLRAELQSEGKLPWQRAIEIALQLAEAMAAAHLRGVIHRDLKPENVMLDVTDRVKVLDFGLAKLDPRIKPDLEDEKTFVSSLGTDLDIGVGTVAYMAPEQALGEPTDSRVDIFSFGVILYEMLAGRRPFRGVTSLASLKATVFASPTALQPGDDLPQSLGQLLDTCLAKRPSDRPKDFGAILHTLTALQRGADLSSATVEEGRPSDSRKSVRQAERNIAESRAEGEADAQLAGTLRDCVGHAAVDTHRRDQECQQAQRTDQDREVGLLSQSGFLVSLEGTDFVQDATGQVGLESLPNTRRQLEGR
ncbi:MAG: serine/threonine protein kinase [Thermoanaerobaculia bacterium]|nr:serine/threonine protein kinase [Thermoanaerobaculia bacterium]